MKTKTIGILFVLFVFALVFSGCASSQKQQPCYYYPLTKATEVPETLQRGIVFNASGHTVELRYGSKAIKLCPKQEVILTLMPGKQVFVIDHLNSQGRVRKTETVEWWIDNIHDEVLTPGREALDWSFYIR